MTILCVNHLGDIFPRIAAHAWAVNPVPIGTLGARLRQARKRKKLTQPQLAEETGVLQSRISELENDKRTKIDVWSVYAVCRHLGITVEYLLEGKAQAGADEAEAVALLRGADPAMREAAMNALRGMLSGKARAAAGRH